LAPRNEIGGGRVREELVRSFEWDSSHPRSWAVDAIPAAEFIILVALLFLRWRRQDLSEGQRQRVSVVGRRLTALLHVGLALDHKKVAPVDVIVGIVNIELNENMEFARPSSFLPSGAQRASRVGCRSFGGSQITSLASVGERRAPPPTQRPASLGEAA
jgi:hypothetical protein